MAVESKSVLVDVQHALSGKTALTGDLVDRFKSTIITTPKQPNQSTSQTKSGGLMALKIAPTILNLMATGKGCTRDHLELAVVCTEAICTLSPSQMRTKTPCSVQKILLNAVKILRKYKVSAKAGIFCDTLISSLLHILRDERVGKENAVRLTSLYAMDLKVFMMNK